MKKDTNQTAMQEFIEQNFYINADGEYEAKWTEDTLWTDQIKNALEKEKLQIELAHTTGYNDCYKYQKGLTKLVTPRGATEYYNQIYNK